MKLSHVFVAVITAGGLVVGAPGQAHAQAQGGSPAPPQITVAGEEAKRFTMGVDGGIGLDPELIMFGGHATFGKILHSKMIFRPGIEFGVGELTTLFGINLDVTYAFQSDPGRWTPYMGTGPNFTLSHKGFETDQVENVDTSGGSTSTTSSTTASGTTTTTTTTDEPSRFNFGDTDFTAGWNFIAGARKGKMFFEMKATAWGVSNVRLLFGVDF